MLSQKRIKEIKEEFGYDFTKMNWEQISRYKYLCENFIEKYAGKVNWNFISTYQKLSEDFIQKYADKVGWNYISMCQHLSEDFIGKHADKVDWHYISMRQHLSEDFIGKHADEVDWNYISVHQKLSEDFIGKHADEVDWIYISKYQKLSKDFIKKYADKVNWNCISRYQVITPEFADKYNININNNSQRTAAEWKEMIEKTGLYECHEDYFYAYKSIRSDRYSHFNFQYQYLPGESYDCFSDYSDNENSFGLSAWTETRAHNYNDNGIVVKLKVNYADVTAIVYDSNKIRCKRITVLN